MPPLLPSFARLSNQELLVEVPGLASTERGATAALVGALAVMDERRLHLGEGYSSLFAYSTECLHLSEPAACRRIEAARASRSYPLILERLAEGTLTLAAVGLLAKLLTKENHVAVLDAARHRSKRQIEELVARLAPQPDVPSSIRKLPTPKASINEATTLAPVAVRPWRGVQAEGVPVPEQAATAADAGVGVRSRTADSGSGMAGLPPGGDVGTGNSASGTPDLPSGGVLGTTDSASGAGTADSASGTADLSAGSVLRTSDSPPGASTTVVTPRSLPDPGLVRAAATPVSDAAIPRIPPSRPAMSVRWRRRGTR